jgi:periplasmic divalent cation tolerance protein
LLTLLESLHPYTLPQLVVQTLQATPAYVCWVDGEVAAGDGRAQAAEGA